MRGRSVFFAWLDEDGRREVLCDAEEFERAIGTARERAAGPCAGFFGPGSQMWRIFGETVVNLGGLRAVLMQLTHPTIASAGLQSSRFRDDFIGRAWRTFATMSLLVFGDLETACDASRQVHVLHARTRGEITVAASPRRAGEPYRGTDPALLLWVLATMYEASTFTFERLVAPLSRAEHRRYWDEMQLLGLLLGIAEDEMPPTLEDFGQYWEAMAAEELEVGEGARELVAFLMRSLGQLPTWLQRWPVRRLASAWMAGSTPQEWARELGIEVDERARRDFERSTVALRRTLHALPAAVCRTPASQQAAARVARAGGGTPQLPARAIEWAQAHWRIPLALEPLEALHGDDPLILSDLFERR